MTKKQLNPLFKKPKDILDFNHDRPVTKLENPRGLIEMDMNPGVKKISKDIDKLVSNCNENHKVAESLCSDIGFHLGKAGELSEKLARYISKINKDYSDYFEHNKINQVIEIGQIYDSATDLLSEVSSQLRNTSKLFSGDMQRMFTFANYENEGFQNLIELRNNFSETYEDAKISLERKKVILFEQKDLRRWGIDPSKVGFKPEELLSNPTLGKKLMLPQVFLALFRKPIA